MKKIEEFLSESKDRLDESRKMGRNDDGSNLIKSIEKELNDLKKGIEVARMLVKVTERTDSSSQIAKYGITKEGDDIILSIKFVRNPDDDLMNKAFMMIDNHRYTKNSSKTVRGFDESFIVKER